MFLLRTFVSLSPGVFSIRIKIFLKTTESYKICLCVYHVRCFPNVANLDNCRLLCHLLVILKDTFANSMVPDQTAPRSSLIRVHTVCLYAKLGLKSLHEYSADDINRHFQMQVSLAF